MMKITEKVTISMLGKVMMLILKLTRKGNKKMKGHIVQEMPVNKIRQLKNG